MHYSVGSLLLFVFLLVTQKSEIYPGGCVKSEFMDLHLSMRGGTYGGYGVALLFVFTSLRWETTQLQRENTE